MTRVVSLFLPTWPTDRARRKAGNAAPPREIPLVLAGHDGRRRAILAADAAAQAAGLRVGMPATKAQALVPGLVMQEANPAADLEALGRLAVWALRRYAPVVSVEPPDGLAIDTTGADHLHGGEEAMRKRRLYRVLPVASDVPERSVGRASPVSPETNESWPDGWPRPVRLLAPPEPIDAIALLPDNPPVAFTWRGTRRRVRCADGPERIFGEWWKRDAELCAVRDYFRVEDDSGERYWIFRSGDGEDPGTGSHRWFMHGVFG